MSVSLSLLCKSDHLYYFSRFHMHALTFDICFSDLLHSVQWSSGPSTSLVAQLVKNPRAMQETLVRFLGREDPLEEGMATHSSILAWRIPMDRGAWPAAVHGVAESWTWLSDSAQHKSLQTVQFHFLWLSNIPFEKYLKKQESSRKTSISALLTMPKPSTV